MYSGHIVILDTVHVSGSVSDGFMIGLPYQYSADVLKALAYDDSHVYDMDLGVQLGDHSGFYGAKINFNGNSPSTFTAAFVLSNSLVTENGSGNFTLDFPAYPSLTQNTATCSVNILLPSNPTTITINKPDGETQSTSYTKTNLPAYTYAIASATAKVPVGTLQLTTIDNLNRQITVGATGSVAALDTYRIVSNSTAPLSSFVLSLPLDASNIIVKDQIWRNTGNTADRKLQCTAC